MRHLQRINKSPPGGRKLSQEAKTRRSLAENATRLRIVAHLGIAFLLGGDATPRFFQRCLFWGEFFNLKLGRRFPAKKHLYIMLICEF